MAIHHLEASIVVAARDCNPTILNPDFLTLQGIISSKWNWKLAGSPITTPPLAMLAYDSGVNITVETNKFQIVQKLLNDEAVTKSKIQGIAQKYIKVLPHVRYVAVGHNFRSLVECTDAESFLKTRFLKTGVWDDKKYSLKGLGLKFVYPLSDVQNSTEKIILSMDSGAVLQQSAEPTKPLNGILLHANFHRDCLDYPADLKIVQYMRKFNADWKRYKRIISDIIL